MSKANEPAFPANLTANGFRGMSLRTYLAGQAMIAIIESGRPNSTVPQGVAIEAFQYADAMIEELEKTDK